MLNDIALSLQPLVQSGYLKPEQVEQVSLGFLKSDRSIMEILESLTEKQLPPSLRKRLLNHLSEFTFLWLVEQKITNSGNFTNKEIEQTLQQSNQSGRPALNILQEITGRQLSPLLLRQYKKHYLFELKTFYGIDFLDVDIDRISTNDIADLIESLIPMDICRRFRLLPIKRETNTVVVTMVDPDNLQASDEVVRRLKPQELVLQRMGITTEDYEKLLELYYTGETEREQEKKRKKKEDDLKKLVDVTEIIENLELNSESEDEIEDQQEFYDLSEFKEINEQSPVITLVNKILLKALKENTSEIHVEPLEDYLRIRFRQEGVLRQAFDPMPKTLTTALVNRLKIMADLDITKRQQPQTANIHRIFQGKKVNFRLSTLPTLYGEKAFLRISTNYSTDSLQLNKLITDEQTVKIVKQLTSGPSGLIVVTGPAESGKSTTLYSILAEKNTPEINISTVEVSIKYSLLGITQIEENAKNGMDYASIIESFLLQDADLILIGETLNKEIGNLAIKAALKGKLVLTTLKAKDAANCISQMNNMDVDPLIVSQALIGVINQRLIRRVCPQCRVRHQPSEEELAMFGLSTVYTSIFYKAKSLNPEQIKEAVAKRNLCRNCKGNGYVGQIGVYEVLPVTKRLRTIIAKNPDAETIKNIAVEEGMKTLLAYALDLVFQGETTLEEVKRVLGDELIFVSSSSEPRESKSSLPIHPQLQALEKQIKTLTYELEKLKKEL